MSADSGQQRKPTPPGKAGAPSSPPAKAAPRAVILAAGKGKRMGSDLPKVLHPVGGRPMVCAVVEACRQVGCEFIVLVVGHGQELVRRAVAEHCGGADIVFAVQDKQLGTGHAVMCAREALVAAGAPENTARRAVPPMNAEDTARRAVPPVDVFVLAGDGPLIRAETLRTLLERHRANGAAATLATSVIDDPTGYGRIVRDEGGRFEAIVEHSSATSEQRAIREVNPSYYCFDGPALFSALERVAPNAESGEYYVTDVPALLLAEGGRVEVIAAVPPEDVLSINTPEQLAEVDRLYRSRRAAGAVEEGAQAGR